MARYDDDEMGEYYASETDDSAELSQILFEVGSMGDPRAQELFDEAFFEGNDGAYQTLIDYLWDVYGLDFEDAFDWEDFRTWYDANAG